MLRILNARFFTGTGGMAPIKGASRAWHCHFPALRGPVVAAFLLLSCLNGQGEDAVSAVSCMHENDGAELVSIHVEVILDCLKNARPVVLKRVRVIANEGAQSLDLSVLRGDSDLEKLAKESKAQRRFAKEPDLSNVERDLGRVTKGVRLVTERLSITDSVIDVEILGPDTEPNIPDAFAPLVFAKLVDFTNTTFAKNVSLPSAQFMGDVRFSRAKFPSSNVNLVKAYFAGEAEFQCIQMAFGTSGQPPTSVRSMTLRGATFAGRFRLDCDQRVSMGHLNLSEVKITGPAARFDKVDFWGTLDLSLAQIAPKPFFIGVRFAEAPQFNGTAFSGGVAFNQASFDAGADFRRATFGSGSAASFDKASFRGNSDFEATRFGAPADFSGVVAPSASFDFMDATFDAEARFHSSRLGVANFENARFSKAATFALTVIGPGKLCGGPDPIGINFDRAVFDGPVDFVSTRFNAAINFSHANFKPGELLVSWSQLAGLSRHLPLELKPASTCASHRIFLPRGPAAQNAEEFYRRIEENFRKQSRLSDATAVYFLKEDAAWEERSHTIGGLAYWIGSFGTWLDRSLWGYGVRPAFVLRAWAVVLVVCGLIYFISGVPMISRKREFTLPTFEITSLPVETPYEPWLPDQAAAGGAGWLPAKLARAMQVSFIAGTGLRVGSATLQIEERSPLRLLLVFERVVGHALLAALSISIAQSIPHIGELFSVLLK